jgi:heat shock protein HtpX
LSQTGRRRGLSAEPDRIDAAAADVCPSCANALTRPNVGQPWCSACEWNLGIYDPAVVPPRGWRWLDRRGHRTAFRLDRSLFEEFRRSRPSRPGWTRARIVLVAVSAMLVVLTLGCLVLGARLVTYRFPSLAIVPGMAFVMVAVGLRPRLGRRPPRRGTLRREQAPALFALVERVAGAAGAAAPHVIAVEPDYNASTGRVGLRRQSVLRLGVPLWIALEPRMRVALLAHEIAHDLNGDPARGLIVQPALSTFRRIAEATGGHLTIGGIAGPDRGHVNIAQVIVELGLWLVSRVFLLVHVGLAALGMRDHQRAEYLADAVAVDVAGSDAMVALLDRLVLLPGIATLIAYNAETTLPARWRGMADSFHVSRLGRLAQQRQLTMRDTSLWHSHPPTGLRARMVEAWPARAGTVELSDAESARIDDELAGWYAAAHRRILGTRDFRGERRPAVG